MPTLSASDLVGAIRALGTDRAYKYYTGRTMVRVTDIHGVEGPIRFIRWPADEGEADGDEGGVSTQQLATAALVFSRRPNFPIHFDRLFSGGGNSRSALETLLANTPNFFICYPRRENPYTGEIESDLKHILWAPQREHPAGSIETADFEGVISVIELESGVGNIIVPPDIVDDESLTLEAKTTHTEIQAKLVRIGRALGFRSWIAKNDRAVRVGAATLGEMEGVIPSLDEVPILFTPDAKRAAQLVDCIWFTADYKYMPAVIEVEHSTGVTSGLTRMLKLREAIPALGTRYTIVAPNEIRQKVVTECTSPVFAPLDPRYMPYSAVNELHGLLDRYALPVGLDQAFVEPFMERMVKGD